MNTPTITPISRINQTITIQALIARINRKLRHEYQSFRTTRGQRWRSNLGDYWIKDHYNNTIAAAYCDPEEVGRKLGVLGQDEQLEKENP